MRQHNTEEKLSVFIADDSTVLRDSLVEILSEYDNIEVIGEAGDGISAKTQILSLVPDMVILDVRMPGMTGLAVLREIRKIHPDMVVCIFTSHDHLGYRTESFESGANYFYHKTTGLIDLLNTIEKISMESREIEPGELDV